MAPKVKGLFKGFKYITQIFVYKEREMEIGHPTEVRHVAHIGSDSFSSNAPSWMRQFNTGSDISQPSLNDFAQSREASWSSQDFEQSRRWPSSGHYTDNSCPVIPKPSKKKKQKKTKTSSPVISRSSSRTSFTTAFEDPNETPNLIPIAYEDRAAEMPNQLQAAITGPVCV